MTDPAAGSDAARSHGRNLVVLERWQADASARHPGVIPCAPGCSACCTGPFDISTADIALLRTGLATLPGVTRDRVRAAAAGQLDRMRAFAPDWREPFDVVDLGDDRFDALTDALAALPCPLLDDRGRCLVYQHRPTVCRIMGLGLESETGYVIENACPIQDRFPTYAALAPEPFPLEAWEDQEDLAKIPAAGELFGRTDRADYETTIAAAIVLFAS